MREGAVVDYVGFEVLRADSRESDCEVGTGRFEGGFAEESGVRGYEGCVEGERFFVGFGVDY